MIEGLDANRWSSRPRASRKAILRGPPIGDVSQMGGKERETIEEDAGKRQLHRKLRPIGTQRRDLDAPTEQWPVARRQAMSKAAAVSRAQRGRDDELYHLLADGIGLRVAEGSLGGGIELDDTALVVYGNHTIERVIQDKIMAAQQGFAALIARDDDQGQGQDQDRNGPQDQDCAAQVRDVHRIARIAQYARAGKTSPRHGRIVQSRDRQAHEQGTAELYNAFALPRRKLEAQATMATTTAMMTDKATIMGS